MDTEIELKYLVLGDDIPAVITNLLEQHQLTFVSQTKQLQNCYFDTADLCLRKADIGLRIRHSSVSASEQTIKTAGKVIGGLHQRPEYNVEIVGDTPDLRLFAANIWPLGFKVADVNQQLTPLFTTNFVRITWLVTTAEGEQIELAFDQGEVAVGQKSELISEIELELVCGERQALFSLAEKLFKVLSLRPGTASKAARGYGLVFPRAEANISSAHTLLDLSIEMPLITSFKAGFEQCLAQLQQLISQFVADPNLLVLKEISDVLALARHGLWLYKDYLDETENAAVRKQIKTALQQLSWVETAKQIRELTTKTGNYRKKIEYSKNLLAELKDEKHTIIDFNQAHDLFYGEQFNVLQLSMLQLILADIPEPQNSTSLSDLAPSWLAINLDDMKHALPDSKVLTPADYLNNHNLLRRSLLTDSWFGTLFDQHRRQELKGPWFDLHLGIDELETLQLLKNHLNDSQQELPIKLINWLDDKMENLLGALKHCQHAAQKLPPYWLS